jgi:hypothetical protein
VARVRLPAPARGSDIRLARRPPTRSDRHVLAGARGRQRDRPVPGPGRAAHCPLAEQGPR